MWIQFFFKAQIFLLFFQQLLNSCFDDIEKFVSRLQQAAEAYKELERRRGERGGKKNKKQYSGGNYFFSVLLLETCPRCNFNAIYSHCSSWITNVIKMSFLSLTSLQCQRIRVFNQNRQNSFESVSSALITYQQCKRVRKKPTSFNKRESQNLKCQCRCVVFFHCTIHLPLFAYSYVNNKICSFVVFKMLTVRK